MQFELLTASINKHRYNFLNISCLNIFIPDF